MLTGISPSSDEINRQSSAIAKRREQLRRWDESETNRESSNVKISQRVKFQQAYVFLAACSSSDRDEVDKLLQRGVDINTSNIDGLTALHQACIDNNLLMVEYLLNRSADINCQDNEGWTPLHAAASCGNIEIVKYLLSRGAIVDVCNNEGELPIDISEGEDIIACLEEDMRKKGIDDEQARNIEHQLMLKHAQDWLNNNNNQKKSLAETIVHARTGATALHVAAAKGYLDVIDILLRAGANINSVDNDGWTPLHAAAHWDKHDVIRFLLDKNADLDAKNYAGQTPLDVCDGVTFDLLREIKDKRPQVIKTINTETPDNILSPLKKKPVPSRSTDEQKSILRSETHNENLETSNKPAQTSLSSLPASIDEPILSNNPPTITEKLNNLQRSLHDLSNRYLKNNQEELINNDLNQSNLSLSDQRIKTNSISRPTYLTTNKSTQRTFTNPLQSLTTNNQLDFSSRESPSNPPSTTLDNKVNRRWGTTDKAGNDSSLTTTNSAVPYVRRRSGVNNNDTTTTTTTTVPSIVHITQPITTTTAPPAAAATTTASALVSVTTSVPTATTNVTVTSSSSSIDDGLNGKRRSNIPPSRDEEAEAQRKHRSAVARRERRSTQSVTQDDIKAAEQQIKSRPTTTNDNSTTMNSNETTGLNLSNNKIGAPSTPSIVNEHDIETERLQHLIEEKKDKARRSSGGNEDIVETNIDPSSTSSVGSRRIRSRFISADTDNSVPSITANDSLNLPLTSSLDSQQQQARRRTNRVHNQRKNTGRIIWNDETKEVEIRDDSNELVPKTGYQTQSIEESHRSDDQKLQENAQQSTNNVVLGSRGLISRFEHPTTTTTPKESPTSPTSRINRSQSQDPSRKSITTTTTTTTNTIPSTTITTTNSLINGMATSNTLSLKKENQSPLNPSVNNDSVAIKRLYDESKRKVDELTQKVERLERDISERDQIIEKLKTSQYIESSLDKREKRAYERKISELEEELKKYDSIKADNTRLKEENAALIRVISKLSK